MISVEYLPLARYKTPLPNGESIYVFKDFNEFKNWVQEYVCIYCLEHFKNMYGRNPETLKDWLNLGCGCEIEIEDTSNLINWEAKMIYTKEIKECLDMT